MRTGTSATRETVSQAWSPVLTAAGVEGQELGRQILALAHQVAVHSLPGPLTDPGREAEDKVALARRLFTGTVDERARRIQEGLDLADKAKQDQADAEKRAARLVDEARREAARIRDNAQGEAKEIIAKARDDAQAEAAGIVEGAQRQILAEKQAAQISLRTDVGMLASTLAERIVGEQLSDTALSERVIDRFLDELETMEPVEGLDTGASSSAEATR